MTICYFGIYQKDYPRNQILVKGLRAIGVDVFECNSREKGIKKYIDLWSQHRKIKNKYDAMIIGSSGQIMVKFAKKLTNQPIILDAFVSQYLTNVLDRKLYKEGSKQAKKDWQLDKSACELADLVLLDTQAQIDYFVKEFKLPREKFRKIFVGSDNEIFHPEGRDAIYRVSGDTTNNTSRDDQDAINRVSTQANNGFLVHFHGYLVPFYGFNTIVLAAQILQAKDPDIKFQVVARFDKAYKKSLKLIQGQNINNITFYPEMPYAELNTYINQADVCLGIFGNNPKAQVVIPNKIYESLACRKSLITAELDVAKELLTDKKNILFCQPNNPEDLAEKILELKNNPDLKNKIAENGYRSYLNKLTPKILGKELLQTIFKIQKTVKISNFQAPVSK